MKKISVIALLTIIASSLLLIPTASAMPSHNNDFGDATGTRPNKKVLVVYDEEIASSNYHFFDAFSTISGPNYIMKQVRRTISRFPWYLRLLSYSLTWDSNDALSTKESCITELEQEIGWVQGVTADILIGWTGQNNDNSWGGCAHVGYGSCLIKVQADWADDNSLQEELTHVFGVLDHCQDDNCVMSRKQLYWSYITENLYPEGGTVIVLIFNWQCVGYISTVWCDGHYYALLDSGGHVAREGEYYKTDLGSFGVVPDEGVVVGDPPCNPTNTQPKEGINPTHAEIPIIFIAMVVAVSCVIIVWKLRRKR